MSQEIRFASATTTDRLAETAARALAAQTAEQMDGLSIDFALLFLTPHFASAAQAIVTSLRQAIHPRVLLGCAGEGVIGRDREIEQDPAMCLIAAHLPDATLSPFFLQPRDVREIPPVPEGLIPSGPQRRETKFLILLGDPFSMPMDRTLEAFHVHYPGVPIIGGMASGARAPGETVLLLDDRVLSAGAVGTAFAGALDVDVIVSQGCRPIGRTFTVTEAQENLISSLDGETPMARVQEMIARLPESERALLRNGLFVGRAISPGKELLGRGDFLIRGVMGVDQKSGAIAVGEEIAAGETIQFHLRDAATAKEDLEMMLTPHAMFGPPRGVFLFSCNGRGTRLYDHPDGDISTIQGFLGGVPAAGFFCAGEIGPVGGRNFLHGHTASLALIRPGK